MKKIFSIILCAAVVLMTGCSGVSQDEYNSLVEANSQLSSRNDELTSKLDRQLKNNTDKYSENKKLSEEYEKLKSEYSSLESQTKDWLKLSDTEKQTEQARAEADRSNAEAEKIEAEARLKAANEKLSEAEAAEQRKLTEGTTVYEDSYVKINYLKTGSYPNNSHYNCVTFLVENKTNGVITFQADSISLNGIDIGDITMSDRISPQSKGYIYACVKGSLEKSPSTTSGQLRIIDFDGKAFANSWESYNATFVNTPI